MAVDRLRQQGKDPAIDFEVPGQVAGVKDVARNAMSEKKRRPVQRVIDRHDGSPGLTVGIGGKRMSEIVERSTLVNKRRKNPHTQAALYIGAEGKCLERVAAQGEKIIVIGGGIEIKMFLYLPCKFLCCL